MRAVVVAALCLLSLHLVTARVEFSCAIPSGELPVSDTAARAHCGYTTSTPTVTAAQLDTVRAAVHRWTPKVFFSPLEPSFPGRVSDWLPHATLYRRDDGSEVGPATPSLLANVSLEENGGTDYYISIGNDTEAARLKPGSAFDADGKSTAPVYARVLPSPSFTVNRGTVIINYNYFYAYNDCALESVILADEGLQYLLPYQFCNLGVHEGDWESMTVEVCANDLDAMPVTVKYVGHGAGQHIRCSSDPSTNECMFEARGGEPYHPVTHIALQTHAAYPHRSAQTILEQFTIPGLDNVEVVSIVDSTLTTPDKVMENDASSVILLPELSSINLTTIANNPGAYPDFTGDAEFSWLLFGGRWGVANFPTPRELLPVECLSWSDHKAIVVCPDSDFIAFVLNDFLPSLADGLLKDFTDEFTSLPGPRGPASRDDWDEYLVDDVSSINTLAPNQPVCPDPALLQEGLPVYEAFVRSEPDPIAISVIVAVATLVMTIGVFTLLAMARWKCPERFSPSCLRALVTVPFFPIVAVCFGLSGYLVWLDGLNHVYPNVIDLVGDNRPFVNDLEDMLRGLPPLVLLVIICTATLTFMGPGRPIYIFCRIRRCQRCLRGSCAHCVKLLLLLGVVALAVCAVVTMLTFSFGSVMFVTQYSLNEACESAPRFVVGACIDLEQFGLESVLCGEDFLVFCNTWTKLRVTRTLVGASFVMVALLLLAVETGSALFFATWWEVPAVEAGVLWFKKPDPLKTPMALSPDPAEEVTTEAPNGHLVEAFPHTTGDAPRRDEEPLSAL